MTDMTDEATPHKRRIRYKGTHPRRFEEKYKELEPERFQDELAKVAARGHTPAGTHRPICVTEILEVLADFFVLNTGWMKGLEISDRASTSRS